jgi:hypothetical protein
MPTIAPNQPIEQRSPDLAISNRLPVGDHRFELVVIDDAGQSSAPASIVVRVLGVGPDLRPDLRDRIDPGDLRNPLDRRDLRDLRDRVPGRLNRPGR